MDWVDVVIIYLAGVLTGISIVACFLVIYCIDEKIIGEKHGKGKNH